MKGGLMMDYSVVSMRRSSKDHREAYWAWIEERWDVFVGGVGPLYPFVSRIGC